MSDAPILAAIAEHRRIVKAMRATVRNIKDDDPMWDLYRDASDRLFGTVPTTVAGAISLLNYVIGKHDSVGHWGAVGVEFPRRLLKSIQKGLVAIPHDQQI
jgi:hypothetical protein